MEIFHDVGRIAGLEELVWGDIVIVSVYPAYQQEGTDIYAVAAANFRHSIFSESEVYPEAGKNDEQRIVQLYEVRQLHRRRQHHAG